MYSICFKNLQTNFTDKTIMPDTPLFNIKLAVRALNDYDKTSSHVYYNWIEDDAGNIIPHND